MTKFMDKSFSTYAPSDDSYRDNWERTFGKKPVSGVSHRCPASAPSDAEAQATKWLDYNWPNDNWEVEVPALARYMTDFAERRSASAFPEQPKRCVLCGSRDDMVTRCGSCDEKVIASCELRAVEEARDGQRPSNGSRGVDFLSAEVARLSEELAAAEEKLAAHPGKKQ